MSIDLEALLLDLSGLTDEQAEELGRAEYQSLYARGFGKSSLIAFDGTEVMFFDDRFDHAFFSTPDRYRRPEAKTKLARDRVERIRWIGPLLQGRIPRTECWQALPAANSRINRLCLTAPELYTVWLEPLKDGRWKFSTAYLVLGEQMAEYKRNKKLVWKV